jgi:hypothetical protein
MNTRTLVTRWITAGFAAAVVISSASTALADRDHDSRRLKGVDYGYPVQRVVVHEHSSSAGPAIAGLIGGFILGTAVSSYSHPVVVHEGYYPHPVAVYRYYDPYGGVWYDSLDQCAVGYRHPRTIEVIDVRSGREVRTLCYRDGGWRRLSGDYDDRDFDRGHDD